MTKRDRSLVVLAVAPNALYVLGLMAAMAWRSSTGLPPMPHGSAPVVLGVAVVLPIVTIGLATLLRLRADPKRLV